MAGNSNLQSLAQAYNRAHGLDPLRDHYASVDGDRARRIVRAYTHLPVCSHSKATQQAYRALAGEVEQQYRWLTSAGYTFTFTPNDPYPDSAAMCADLRENKHLKVYTGGDDHPYLSRQENEHFRAVHDCFGHAAEGYQFGPRGEENAWIHHSQMFSPLAQRALTTETRGQNSWVNFGPYASLPVRERPFARQKAALLPAWVCDWRQAMAIA